MFIVTICSVTRSRPSTMLCLFAVEDRCLINPQTQDPFVHMEERIIPAFLDKRTQETVLL